MDKGQLIALVVLTVLLGPVVLWAVARICFTAYFYTRQQHERKKHVTR